MVQANSAFVDSTLQLLEQLKKDLKNNFSSEFQEVSYSLPEEAAQIINAWVDQNTHGKIKDFIDPESIDPLVRMMLVNAIYFKGKQITEFTLDVNISRCVEGALPKGGNTEKRSVLYPQR